MITSIVLIAAYIAAQMLSDVGSLRIVLLAGFTIDAGTLIYPLTFTLRDLVHKYMGKRAAQTVIVSAAVINLVMAGFFALVAWLPADLQVGAQVEFGVVLSPVWRIVIASIAAEVVSELIDTEVYAWYRARTRRWQWGRVLLSNAISIPVDSAIFCVGAFGGVWAWEIVGALFISNIMLKCAVMVFSLPMIYAVKEQE